MLFLILFGVLIIFLGILNETGFIYRENSSYTLPDESKLMSSETGSFGIKNGSEKLIIFVHGFPSTPAVYRWAAEQAVKAGWDVNAPLLPGFGTAWQDLLNTNFSQWYAYIRDVYLENRRKYRKIAIAGTSMGGSLTLKLAEEFSSSADLAPDAVVTIAAPVFINRLFRYGILKNPLYYFVRTLGWFFKSYKPENINSGSNNDVDGRGRWRGYAGEFPRQIFSLKIGLKQIDRDLEKITVPYLIFHDKKDRTVPFLNAFHIAGKVRSGILELHITNINGFDHEHHSLLIYDSTRQEVMDRMLEFLDREISG